MFLNLSTLKVCKEDAYYFYFQKERKVTFVLVRNCKEYIFLDAIDIIKLCDQVQTMRSTYEDNHTLICCRWVVYEVTTACWKLFLYHPLTCFRLSKFYTKLSTVFLLPLTNVFNAYFPLQKYEYVFLKPTSRHENKKIYACSNDTSTMHSVNIWFLNCVEVNCKRSNARTGADALEYCLKMRRVNWLNRLVWFYLFYCKTKLHSLVILQEWMQQYRDIHCNNEHSPTFESAKQSWCL